ncbi:MAG: hypothetical protein V3573_13415 [Desulfovibrionaceae bacterium]
MTKKNRDVLDVLRQAHWAKESEGRLDSAWVWRVMCAARAEKVIEPGAGWFARLGDLLPAACLLALLAAGLFVFQAGDLPSASADVLGQGFYGSEY